MAGERCGAENGGLTQERLKELLHYNPETGVFTWLVARGFHRNLAGKVAGSLHKKGYIHISVDWKDYKAHRLAWLYMEGYWPEHVVEHRDRVKTNNKWSNLRHVTQACNVLNTGKRKDNKSGVIGVDQIKGKWRAQIQYRKQKINIGTFSTKLEAAKARWAAEVRLGFPNCNTTSSALNFIKQQKAA